MATLATLIETAATREEQDAAKLSRRQLAEKFVPLAHSLANKQARKFGGDADDLAQDAMIAIINASKAWDDAAGVKFITLAYRYVRTCFANDFRVSRAARRDDSGVGPLAVDPVDYRTGNDPCEAFDALAALETMPDRERVAVTEYIMGGSTLDATAKRIGVSRQGANNVLRRALAMLAKKLGDARDESELAARPVPQFNRGKHVRVAQVA